MKSNIITIAKKELARFLSNKASALVVIVLPGLLIFGIWSFMGDAMSTMFSPDKEKPSVIAVVNEPASIEALASSGGIEFVPQESLPNAEDMRTRIEQGDIQAFAAFPSNFDADVAQYDPASGAPAPQVGIYYNSSKPDSSQAFHSLSSLLDAYESSLSNRFDVNAGQDTVYDVADQRDKAGSFVVSIVPFMLLLFLFTSCMAIAAESVAGEKERGTMATLLATPIRRRDIALGKIIAVALIGLLSTASSMVGVFAGLSNLSKGGLDMGVYGAPEYALLACVAASTALVVVMLITIVSTFAKSTKEATTYLTPLMIVVMLVGLLGMVGGAKSDLGYYVIPLYNSVQCMIGIFTFDFQPLNVAVCVVANLVYTGVGVIVLQRMFDSERLMFAR